MTAKYQELSMQVQHAEGSISQPQQAAGRCSQCVRVCAGVHAGMQQTGL